MQKWEYAHAIYNKGVLEPYMNEGLQGLQSDSIGPFLQRAGAHGWEMCGVLPYPTGTEPDGMLAVIFKRPA